jgi:hypothetical protein
MIRNGKELPELAVREALAGELATFLDLNSRIGLSLPK